MLCKACVSILFVDQCRLGNRAFMKVSVYEEQKRQQPISSVSEGWVIPGCQVVVTSYSNVLNLKTNLDLSKGLRQI